MQSLGQAVYRYICKFSPNGVARRSIIEEMASRGYLQPLGERVDSALQDYMSSDFVKFKRGKYLKNIPYWRSKNFQSQNLNCTN